MPDGGSIMGVLRQSGRVAPSGLQLRRGMSFETWTAMGQRISVVSNGSAWWLGDWLVYGQRAYGDRYRAALDATGLDYQTLRNYAWVARRFEMSRRRDSLSFQHHAEVAAMSEPEQELWLQRADQLRWSRNELRRRLTARTRSGDEADAQRMVRLRVVVTTDREQEWRRAAESTGQTLSAWMAAALDAAASVPALEPPSAKALGVPRKLRPRPSRQAARQT